MATGGDNGDALFGFGLKKGGREKILPEKMKDLNGTKHFFFNC